MPERSYASVFAAAVWCFLLAAAAGVMLRFVMVGFELPAWLEYANLRRAHSHLMLSGWVTPAAFAVMASFAARRRSVHVTLWASLVLAVLAFPSFALWGYGFAELGDARVPMSVILSTLSMFTWYAFALLWRGMRADVAQRVSRASLWCWDAALVLLALSSIGAWLRGMLTGMKVSNAFVEAAVIEFFLSTYVEGFLLLSVLGLLLVGHTRNSRVLLGALGVIALATPAEFLAFLPVDLVPAGLRPIGAVAVVLASAGILVVAWSLRRRAVAPIIAGLAIAKLILVSPDAAANVMGLGLRIPYLHVLLLGLVTPVLLTAALDLRRRQIVVMHIAIWISLATLLPTTGLWPVGFDRATALSVTAGAAVLPPLFVLTLWALRRRRSLTPAAAALVCCEAL